MKTSILKKLPPIKRMHAFHYTNKRTGDAGIYGSMEAIAQHIDLKIDTLKHHFSRNKSTKYENHTHLIYKLPIIRSGGNQK